MPTEWAVQGMGSASYVTGILTAATALVTHPRSFYLWGGGGVLGMRPRPLPCEARGLLPGLTPRPQPRKEF